MPYDLYEQKLQAYVMLSNYYGKYHNTLGYALLLEEMNIGTRIKPAVIERKSA